MDQRKGRRKIHMLGFFSEFQRVQTCVLDEFHCTRFHINLNILAQIKNTHFLWCPKSICEYNHSLHRNIVAYHFYLINVNFRLVNKDTLLFGFLLQVFGVFESWVCLNLDFFLLGYHTFLRPAVSGVCCFFLFFFWPIIISNLFWS